MTVVACALSVQSGCAQETETMYLSGHGCDDMVVWDFYCTGGRTAGEWTTIGVPSCWETQGFGTYQYGYEYNKWNKKPSKAPIADEKGLYRHAFRLPKEWRGRKIEIVFEAAMTDTEVRINGRSAGDVHQGGFSPFRYDITELVKFGRRDNLLEVTVSKESADGDMNLAERRCDFWNFGGIYQPRDGRDNYLYRLPDSGISILKHIPAVRNNVDYSDLNGPSAQPHWCAGEYGGTVMLMFE